ncbi:septum site-determining protein Ssd [Kitasatospora sp. NPDC052896]|uniref:septum site-determining protein Ssd n=1 Tax=Kitasatospora sp. NPDC052896 TaxID=3364061 RepID=UPI0037C7A339
MSTPTTDQYEPGAEDREAKGPLILTADEALAEHLLRLCAAAGTEPQVLSGAPPPLHVWETVPLVLIGDDVSEHCAGLTRRPGVLLLGSDLGDHDVWVRGIELGAEEVLFLPDAESWLLDRIADAVERVGPPALTVAVIGGRGGVGASTLACALAVTAARAGHRTMLIDGDPLGGGLDVLLGGESADGLRWPDLAAARGRLSGPELADALPQLHSLSALSWDRSDALVIPPEAMRSVLAAARRRGGLVVLDLPRHLDPATREALDQADTGLLLVPAELRGITAAGRVATAIAMRLADLRAVIRLPGPIGLSSAEIAGGLGLPLAGEVTREAGLSVDVERGNPPGLRRHGALARFCTGYLTEVMPTITINGGAVS